MRKRSRETDISLYQMEQACRLIEEISKRPNYIGRMKWRKGWFRKNNIEFTPRPREEFNTCDRKGICVWE